MRNQLKKLIKGKSTKGERRFMELLKKLRIPFQTKVIISGREVDFLIGNNVIELDAHEQDPYKNSMLLESGYIPFHFYNWEVNDKLIDFLKNLYGRNINTDSNRR